MQKWDNWRSFRGCWWHEISFISQGEIGLRKTHIKEGKQIEQHLATDEDLTGKIQERDYRLPFGMRF